MLKEVDLIQGIIGRMATNSFMVKGWTVTLVVAAMLLQGSPQRVAVAFVPLFAFWYLDAYFLQQELMYRRLHDWVVNNRLRTDEYLLDMKAIRFQRQVRSKCRIMFSTTLGWFYGSITLSVAIYSLGLAIAGRG